MWESFGIPTQIEDLFYNLPARRQSFRVGEEYRRILEQIGEHAVHYADRGVEFVLRKAGVTTPDVQTSASDDIKKVVRSVYGSALANELLPIQCSLNVTDQDTEQTYQVRGWVSHANYHVAKEKFILFANNRRIEWGSLRRVSRILIATVC